MADGAHGVHPDRLGRSGEVDGTGGVDAAHMRQQDPRPRLCIGHLFGDLEDLDALVVGHERPGAVTRDEIEARAQAARAELAILPQGPARRALDKVCDEVVNRSH